MASILPNTDSLQLGRSYTTRLYLISGDSSAPHIQPLPLPVLSFHHLLDSFYEFPANLLLRRPLYNYCCSGGYCTTTQRRKPSHNYCCSGGHRTTAAPVAIAQQLLRRLSIAPASSSSISDSTLKFATSSLNATVPISQS